MLSSYVLRSYNHWGYDPYVESSSLFELRNVGVDFRIPGVHVAVKELGCLEVHLQVPETGERVCEFGPDFAERPALGVLCCVSPTLESSACGCGSASWAKAVPADRVIAKSKAPHVKQPIKKSIVEIAEYLLPGRTQGMGIVSSFSFVSSILSNVSPQIAEHAESIQNYYAIRPFSALSAICGELLCFFFD